MLISRSLCVRRVALSIALGLFPAGVATAQALRPRPSPAQTRASLQGAIDACDPGAALRLESGVYELDAALRLSGSITLQAVEGAEVVFSGGRRLELDWEEAAEGGVWRSRLPGDLDLASFAFDQLFLDGVRLHAARFPDHDPGQRVFGGTSADALSPARVARWQRPAGGIIHSLHRSEWGGNHWRITGKNPDGSLVLEGGWMNNRPSGINPQHRFVEGIREELNAPGEWFLDREERVLWVIPPVGLDLGSAEVVASGIERLIEVVGKSAQAPVEGVHLRGLSFAHTARTFMKTDEPLLRSDWRIHRGGAVFLENVRGVKIEDCEFHRLGGNGVFVSGHADGVALRRCHLHELGASGVCFVGKPEAVRSPCFGYPESLPLAQIDRSPGPKSEDYPRDCEVEDCLIHAVGITEKQVAGVQISMAARITVRHVSIYDTPRAGINISEGTWGGHLIEGCDVFDTVQMTGDHGSFNSWGRDRYWHPNRGTLDALCREHPELILLDAGETTVLRGNRWRCDHGWDIDLDDGSSNYELVDNLCLHGGIKLREGFHRHVHNNIMVDNSFHPHVWFEDSHDVFEHNIVMTAYRPIRMQGWGERVDGNLFPDAAALQQAREQGVDAHSVAGDPRFLDPASGNFAVAEDSPALGLGFVNFPMDRFGVQAPALRRLARVPVIPSPGSIATVKDARSRRFLGAVVKRLQGMGERSSTGMGAERGVLLVSVPEGSPADRSGLRANDVLLRVGGVVVDRPSQLQPAYLDTRCGSPCDLLLFRDQREQTLSIDGGLALRFAAEDAAMSGKGRAPVYDAAKDYLGAWTDPAISLHWDVRCSGPMIFEVYAELAATPDAAGATWSFSIAGRTLEGVTPNTGGWEAFQRVRLGQIRFEGDGELRAELRPIARPGVAVMNLRAIELIRPR